MSEKIVNHSQLEILQDRYQLGKLLGAGGAGSTYQAIDLETKTEVAVKILSLRGIQDWKTLELFEREAKILAQLDHPQIPKYLDFFHIDTEADRKFCIVQQLAPGRCLADLVVGGGPFTVPEVEDIASQILEILTYLQSFSPAIIHRDLKPQNIICNNRPTGNKNAYRRGDTNVYLIDFGTVQDTYHQTITGGSTVVGTYGYMAPEQFRGQANVTTDLYGLATTLLFLLTSQDPADLPQQRMKLNIHSIFKVQGFDRWSDHYQYFKHWLDRCLEPFPENRFANAGVALKYLQSYRYGHERWPRPKHPLAQITRSDEPPELQIHISPIWLKSKVSRQIFIVNTVILVVLSFLTWLLMIAELPSVLMYVLVIITQVSGVFLHCSMNEYHDEHCAWRWLIPLALPLRLIACPGIFIATCVLIAISNAQRNYILPYLPVLLFLWGYIIVCCLRHLSLMSERYSYHLTTYPDASLNYQSEWVWGRVTLNSKGWPLLSRRKFDNYECFVSNSSFNFLSIVNLIDRNEELWLGEEIRNFIEIHKIR
jgi:eukaryotic-like serine/threonine-protein kinase